MMGFLGLEMVFAVSFSDKKQQKTRQKGPRWQPF
jgi:hypothetical protein